MLHVGEMDIKGTDPRSRSQGGGLGLMSAQERQEGLIERSQLSWTLKDEETFTRQVWTFVMEGTKEQKQQSMG